MPLKSELLLNISANLDPERLTLGFTPEGDRTIIRALGGTFEGPKLRGKILPGGGDWFRTRSDGVGFVDVRATLQTDDGALIYVQYFGVLDVTPEQRTSIFNGEDVPASDYYFRVSPRFETGAPQYAWLNNLVTVGIGRIETTGVGYEIYAIK